MKTIVIFPALLSLVALLAPIEAVEPAPGLAEARERAGCTWVGLTQEQAQALATERGKMSRVSSIDGQGLMMTADHRPGRLNLTLWAGSVIHVDVEGEPSEQEGVTDVALLGYLGLTEEVAVKQLAAAGLVHRVAMRDGQWFGGDRDYSPNRLNLYVRNGKVMAIAKH